VEASSSIAESAAVYHSSAASLPCPTPLPRKITPLPLVTFPAASVAVTTKTVGPNSTGTLAKTKDPSPAAVAAAPVESLIAAPASVAARQQRAWQQERHLDTAERGVADGGQVEPVSSTSSARAAACGPPHARPAPRRAGGTRGTARAARCVTRTAPVGNPCGRFHPEVLRLPRLD